MTDFKIISDTEDEIEIELIQPNDLLGDTSFWNDDDWIEWREKMAKLEVKNIRGQIEIIRIKLKKNPFIDGNKFYATDGIEGSNKDTKIESTDINTGEA